MTDSFSTGKPGAGVRVLCGALRYERRPERVGARAGSYDRKAHTKAGEVYLKMPKLGKQPFETDIIQRYCRCEASIEASLRLNRRAGDGQNRKMC